MSDDAAIEQRVIDLAVLKKQMVFATNHAVVQQAHQAVLHGAIDPACMDVLVGTTDPTDASEDPALVIRGLNTSAFKAALLQTWTRASLYLRVASLVVLAVQRRNVDWLVKMAENVDPQRRAVHTLPYHIVELDPAEGTLTYVRDRRDHQAVYRYEPRSDVERAAFFYHVFAPPDRPLPLPLLAQDLDPFTLDVDLRRYLNTRIRATADGGDGEPSVFEFGPRGSNCGGACYVLPSPFFALREYASNEGELRLDLLQAAFAQCWPRFVAEQRPPEEFAPDFVGPAARARNDSLRGAAHDEMAKIGERGFWHGVQLAEHLRPEPAAQDAASGEALSTREVARRRLGRADPMDDMYKAPAAIGRIIPPGTAPAVDLSPWRQRFYEEVARVFSVPLSFIDATLFTSGQAALATHPEIGELIKQTYERERQALRLFWMTVYDLTFGGLELALLSSWTHRLQQHERLALGRFFSGGSGRRSSSTASYMPRKRRRATAHRLLQQARPGEDDADDAPLAVEYSGLGDGDDDDEAEAETITVADLRTLIVERLQAKRALPATLRFGADQLGAELCGQPLDALGPTAIKTRMDEVQLLGQLVPALVLDRDSTVARISELLALPLKASTEPLVPVPPVAPGSGGGSTAAPKRKKARTE